MDFLFYSLLPGRRSGLGLELGLCVDAGRPVRAFVSQVTELFANATLVRFQREVRGVSDVWASILCDEVFVSFAFVAPVTVKEVFDLVDLGWA